MAASRLSVLVFLLPALLCAGQGVVDIKTPALPVNGTVGHSVWLPVERDHIPEKAEITWRFCETGRTASIARLDTSDGKIKTFEDTGFEGRVTMYNNLTLQINDLRMGDGGIYTVTVTGGGRDYTGKVILQVYEPVSVPSVKLIEKVSAESCNVTLLCSVEMGTNISYTWTSLGTNQTDGEVGQLSGNTAGELKLSVGISDPIHYRCTVWNAVSEESGEIRTDPPCPAPMSKTKQSKWLSVLQICLGGSVLIILIALLAASKYCPCLNPGRSTVRSSHATQHPTTKT